MQTHHNLDFKPTQKNTNTISYLEITMKRDDNNLAVNTHSKPTHTDKAIHFRSNHAMQHKQAAYRHMLNRMYTYITNHVQGETTRNEPHKNNSNT
jgi:hypothetical protein